MFIESSWSGILVNNNPKVLVVCATYFKMEKYLQEYIQGLKNQTYKNFEVLFINSSGEGHEVFRGELLKHGAVVDVEANSNINEVLVVAYNKARSYLKEHSEYDGIWLLEADQIPKPETLQSFVNTKLDIVGAPYLLDKNSTMVCVHDFKTELAYNAKDIELMPDTPQQVWGCGHGCVYVHRSVVDKIPFRLKDSEAVHEPLNAAPDSYWYIDLKREKINVYVMPRLWTKHLRVEDNLKYRSGLIKVDKPTFVRCRGDYWGNGQEPKFFIMKGQTKKLPDYIDEITKHAFDSGLLVEVK